MASQTPTTPPGLIRHADGLLRCWWCGQDEGYVAYHDTEWGRPQHDERALFEKLCLEGFQAGLSWLTILRKRPAFRAAFADFDPVRMAAFGDADVARLTADPGIVRSRAKIEAAIGNARVLVGMWERDEHLTSLVWAHAPAPRDRPDRPDQVPARTQASTALAAALKRQGFRFVGPTTAYAFMQSMGLVDDHLSGCDVPVAVTTPPAAP